LMNIALSSPMIERRSAADGPPLLELQEVSKWYGGHTSLIQRVASGFRAPVTDTRIHAVDGVSVAIRQGGMVGRVGESGCGKSTVGRLITGLLRPSKGQVLYRGEDRASLRRDEAKAATLKTQMIF